MPGLSKPAFLKLKMNGFEICFLFQTGIVEHSNNNITLIPIKDLLPSFDSYLFPPTTKGHCLRKYTIA